MIVEWWVANVSVDGIFLVFTNIDASTCRIFPIKEALSSTRGAGEGGTQCHPRP